MRKLMLTFIVIALSSINVIAQIEATTKNGKKVILNEDGTWKFEELNTPKEKTPTACSKYIETNNDKMTGKSTIASKDYLILSKDGGAKGISIMGMISQETLIISIKAIGSGNCIDDDSKMNILFRDGTRLELKNNGKFNCKAKFTLYFGDYYKKTKELEILQTKEIETMRVWTSNGYVEEDLSLEQSKQFMKTIFCLNESLKK